MQDSLRRFVEHLDVSDVESALRLLETAPQLAGERAKRGATREAPSEFYFDRLRHYLYEGDTALHMAAAACQPRVVEQLIARGADVHAHNRRGAAPLHYAVDGGPGSPAWDSDAQAQIVRTLIGAGADPNAADASGVAPLHRAVRNRCAAAVAALLDGGADAKAPNKRGSTPMMLAAQTTGRSGSGSAAAKAQQQEILRLLAERGG